MHNPQPAGESEEKLVIHLIKQEIKMITDVNTFRSKSQSKLNWNPTKIYEEIDSKDINGIDFE